MNIYSFLPGDVSVEAAEGHRRAEHLRALKAGVSSVVTRDASPLREPAQRSGLLADEAIEIVDAPIVNPDPV